MALHEPSRPIRIVTAAAIFDGHDAAINIMRRILQSQGAEVVHLGHNRSVQDIVQAAVQEDADAVAVSSYQGGHVEFFTYLLQELQRVGAGHVRVFGGGGGTIVPAEVQLLEQRGVARIFTPQDGQRMGLSAMVNAIIEACDRPREVLRADWEAVRSGDERALAQALTLLQEGSGDPVPEHPRVPVLGVTGTGGAGKSSLVDELILRLRADQGDALRIAVLAVDPTRRRAGGALLGDRIRMNAIGGGSVFFRSLATRGAASELPDAMPSLVAACALAGYHLVIVETPGIGQGDSAVVDLADCTMYVMTADFGAATQLEKIDMLDFADVVAINKFERRGSEDARRDVARQLLRNREAFDKTWEDMPVFGTSAACFNDDGVTALYLHLRTLLEAAGLQLRPGSLAAVVGRVSTGLWAPVPGERVRYLAEIADAVRSYRQRTEELIELVQRRALHSQVARVLPDEGALLARLAEVAANADTALGADARQLLAEWPDIAAVRQPIEGTATGRTTLSGNIIPRVAVPSFDDEGTLLRFLRREHLPGHFPFTAGVFPFKREQEDPTRMFAGEGDAYRTNARFHLLSAGQSATRLSTAFDSVTLYGRDPEPRPDVLGKVGTSGVSIATLDDLKVLYSGFDLCAASTSVSMTINGPAPAMLAFFFNTAIDQQVEAFVADAGREPDAGERETIVRHTLHVVRGTVQADILKEDQGQNTCIFSTEFSLRMMADIQQWFIEHEVANFYSVSISGYHIAEAGANPITQLAFTLANGFTYVEMYRARGMRVDAFAPNLSFFFSNGMDAEYTVLGRVARRIWAIAMRDRYGANARAQKLKYHIQTSGRSLHAQEMSFNDIRTTLQALNAIYDNANSLHTNAYDEAVTTPSPESVRRAMAIQLIINREWGLAFNENPLQGSFIVDELTDLVEEAVLLEFDRLTERGGVLGAMETGYQRSRIQEESMRYEQRKHDGSLPIVGVNTFVGDASEAASAGIPLSRGTDEEKASQLLRLQAFHERHASAAPAALERLRAAVLSGDNAFSALMDAARVCSLGEITQLFFDVGGEYRRSV